MVKARTLSTLATGSTVHTLSKAWPMLTPSQQRAMRKLSWHWEGRPEPLVRLHGTVAFEANGFTFIVGKRGKVTSHRI